MTFTVTWTLPKAEAEKLTDAITDWASSDMTEMADDRWSVTAYFSDRPDDTTLEAATELAIGTRRLPPIKKLADEDWVAKSLTALAPVVAGRYLVHGSHDRERAPANAVTIEIDAATAFGTGHHGTTAGCLVALSELAKRRRVANALDVGTGSGVLAIAIAKTWRIPVLATDIDPVAVDIARNNARLNRAAGFVQTIRAAGMAHRLLRQSRGFDLVTANILAGPLANLSADIARAVVPGGTIILSGLLPTQQRWIVGSFRNRGFAFRRAMVRDAWLTLELQKPSGRRDTFVGAAAAAAA